MKTILSIVSVLMLVIGAITLGTGALDVGLLLGSDGGAVAEALAGLAVVMFAVCWTSSAACWACGRPAPARPAAPSPSACWASSPA